MGFMDSISAEDRVQLTVTTLIALIREAERSRAKADFMSNAVTNKVLYEDICAIFDLKRKEEE